ncbi:MAG TPA: trypsin-like peptidase domain-containing protein [Candidatus Nitrosotalea sp.]|nr:trypsin-like peptidase domain-containing protein [Candidatus Nitrosotalea sp.]
MIHKEYVISIMRKLRTVLLAAVILVVLGSTGVIHVNQSSASHEFTDKISSPDYVSLFKMVQNSVVKITSTVSDPSEITIINGMPSNGETTMLGSGFMYDTTGHIVTNAHVVGQNNVVYVTLTDGDTYTAKVVGTDPYNDLAVIQMTGNFTGESIVPLQLGNSSQLEVGQYVAAIGNPFGLEDTMTNGIVSQLGRSLNDEETGSFSIPDVIQTSAAINPGNSGGPLLNMDGQVIGMNTAIKTDTGNFAGIGYAIPSNQIARIVPILIKDGAYHHTWLGIEGRNLTPDIALANGLERNSKGVVIEKVSTNSSASKAGLEAATDDQNGIPHGGDIIVSVDGHPVKSVYDITAYQDNYKSVGDTMNLGIDRAGKIINVIVTLQARPPPLPPTPPTPTAYPSFPQVPGFPQIPGFPQVP